MQLSEMRTAVADLAGDSDNSQFSVAMIDRYLNWAQMEIARRYDVLEKVITITSLDSTDLVGGALLPTDFLRVVQVWWSQINLYPIPAALLFEYQNVPVTTGAGTPQYYTIENYRAGNQRRMSFYPYQTPGATGLTIRLNYVGAPIDLTGPTDVSQLPLNAHESVVLYAVQRLKVQENDLQAANMLKREFDERMQYLGFQMSVTGDDTYAEMRADGESFYPLYD